MMTTIGIWYMGGDKIKSIADIYGVHLKLTEYVIDMFLDAVETSKSLPFSINLLPNNSRDQAKFADKWEILSSGFGIMKWHIAPIDGWLCTTYIPWDMTNKMDFFSDHYQQHGLNVQDMCNTDLQIVYICVAGSGKIQKRGNVVD